MKKTMMLFLSILFALAVTMLWSTQAAQRAVADKLVRLHVLANSDDPADQALKLEVRDAVLAEAEAILRGCRSREEAARRLSGSLGDLEKAAVARLAELGSGYTVRLQLGEEVYPRRNYENFALPAGEYLSMRVMIGEGAGQNWWCVVFPPLCLAATAETVEEEAAAAGFGEGEIALITGEGGDVQIRFWILDQLAKWKK